MNQFLLIRLFVLVLLVFSWPPLELHAAKINSNQLDAFIVTSLKLLETEDFEGLAMMYHYPPTYTRDELAADLRAVENSLKMFNQEFGRFASVTPLESRDLYVNIYATSGSHAYWDHNENAYKVELETKFRNYGPGYLIFHIVDFVGTLEIKAIAYGLPVSGESVARIKKVGEQMLLLKQQREQRETVPAPIEKRG